MNHEQAAFPAEIDEYLKSRTTTIAKDLKLNLKRTLGDGSLTPEEAHLALLAVAAAAGNAELAGYAQERLRSLGLAPDQIQEAEECAAIMGMLNTYYRFRHFVGKEEDYRSAGLRMTALAKPALGKERFEMLAMAVSVLNGCETCVKAHEQALRDAGAHADKVHELARLAAIVKGITALGQ